MPKRSRNGVVSRPDARGRADQGKGRQIDAHRARRRPFADDQVELEILHRRIENFLYGRIKAMDFVDEQHIVRLEIGQQRRQIARLGNDRAGCRAKTDAQLARDDLRQRRLAEARRPEQQNMVERFAARPRRG